MVKWGDWWKWQVRFTYTEGMVTSYMVRYIATRDSKITLGLAMMDKGELSFISIRDEKTKDWIHDIEAGGPRPPFIEGEYQL